MTRVYIHETMTISIKHRKDYLDHFCRVWAPRSRELYGMTCFGVWATNGSTGPWPEAVVMWEYPSHAAFSAMMSGEFDYLSSPNAPMKGHYEEFWENAAEGVVENTGCDRLMASVPGGYSLQEAIDAGRRGVGYYHQTIIVRPGAIEDYLARYDAEWRPVAEDHGLVFIGAYRTMLGNDNEGIALWRFPNGARGKPSTSACATTNARAGSTRRPRRTPRHGGASCSPARRRTPWTSGESSDERRCVTASTGSAVWPPRRVAVLSFNP